MKKSGIITGKDYKSVANRVSVISIIINLLLSVFKLTAGIVSGSGAMISDAVHSASDVFSTFIVIIGVSISSRKADREHQYGHERLECVASVILALVLGETAVWIGWSGIQTIFSGKYEEMQIPGILALSAAVVSIIVKELMYQYTKKAAKRINSDALMADAWHHRTDSLSSVGAFIGILGARMGFSVLEPVASIVIAVFIVKAAFDIFKDSIDKMVDKSCDVKTVEELKDTILSKEGVKKIDDLKTRLFGAKMYVDVEISVDGSLPLTEAHEIAESVHQSIESTFPTVKHCMVHVNPYNAETV